MNRSGDLTRIHPDVAAHAILLSSLVSDRLIGRWRLVATNSERLCGENVLRTACSITATAWQQQKRLSPLRSSLL
jgi:hypothetical protein